ncbi:hypothetical protein [Gorillibacterium sp. CAU 1737]|uniref:hypothetical protein n=1 Tax=Gorillibacterium sp. CAU 1737 TaxID=3140362 RepID=UPI00326150D3
MGLDAYVQCNCVKEGKAKVPPFDSSLLEWTEDGMDLSESADDETYHLYLKWREEACEHEDFYYYYDRVANAWGSNFLIGAMERLGRADFPLFQTMFNASFPTEQAKEALKQLDHWESRIGELKGIFLLESGSHEEYQKALLGDDRWFYSNGGEYTYRLSNGGFSIVAREGQELFWSSNFEQEVHISEEIDQRNRVRVRFTDKETGKAHETNHPFSRKTWGVEDLHYPTSLHVVERELTSTDFHSLGVLRKLLQASLQTGNPIIWS